MKVVIRVDASIQMGSGHVMRCLTLAEALRGHGAEVHFICREHNGHLIKLISEHGFSISVLGTDQTVSLDGIEKVQQVPKHAHWLDCDWRLDAQQTAEILSKQKPDWLVVDHYALDRPWERAMRNHVGRIMVIDDLADRSHDCDLLLDQNLGRKEADYSVLLPQHAQTLIGPKYALLRPEFAALRDYSLERRKKPKIRSIMISMGGVDQFNTTGSVLESLKNCPLHNDCSIAVAMGQNAPWLESVQQKAETLPWHTEILINIDAMAQRMADSDLAIGAGGTTSWERCCLGLPTLIVVVAENQRQGVHALRKAGGAHLLGSMDSFFREVDAVKLGRMSRVSASVTDGQGTYRVVRHILDETKVQCCIRPVTQRDESLLLEMANDKLARQNAFNSDPIAIPTHRDWFKKRFNKLDFCRIYIIETNESEAIGQVRLERNFSGLWEIDFAILPRFRGFGLGETTLRMALCEFQKSYQNVTVVGKVKIENKLSSRIFEVLGFDGYSDEKAGIRIFQQKLGPRS